MYIFISKLKQIQKVYFLLIAFGLYGMHAVAQVPANDEPCGAVALTPSSTCSYTQATNVNATQSSGMNNAQCGTPVTGDVWFSVVVPAGVTTLSFSTEAGTLYDGVMQLYRSNATPASCSSLTRIGGTCADEVLASMPAVVATGLTPGSTVWVRFWNYDDGLFVTPEGTFGICVIAGPPSNDNPCNAIPLTVGQNCNSQIFSNAGATLTSGPTAPGCANLSGGDVWFTAVVPAAGGTLVFDTQEGTLTDGGMAIYSGTCGNLTLIECNDDGGTGLMPQIINSTLTPGSTIWIRVWEYGNNNNGTFGICVSNPPPAPACSGNDPAGNTCETATPVCNFNGYCGNTSDTYTADYWDELLTAFVDCNAGLSIENNSFVTFVATSTSASFNVWVTTSRDGFGIQMFFFDATCGSPTVTCHGGYQFEQSLIPHLATATNLIPGHTYYLMFDGNGGDVCDYILAPVSGVSVLSVTPSAASICPGGSVDLSVSGGDGVYTWTGSDIGSVPGANITVSPTTTTTYTVTSTNTAGSCPVNQDVIVSVNIPPVFTASGTDLNCSTVCDGTAFVNNPITGTGPYIFSWTDGTSTIGSTQTISNLCVGTYDVTVTDANGCTSSTGSTTPISGNCFDIQSIFVNSCSALEYDEEMVFFHVGANPINTSAMTVTWPTSALSPNVWQGLTTNAAYIASVNATITGGGQLLPLPGDGILPANANVVLISGTPSTSSIDFTGLAVPLYALFQATGNTAGHFSNNNGANNDPLVINFGGGCSQTATYDPTILVGTDGAAVNYSSTGVPSYVNNGCVIPTIQSSISSVVLVSLNAPAEPTFTQLADICNGGSFTLPTSSNNTPTAITGSWTPPNNTSATTLYTFTPTTGLCADTASMTVTVITPAGPIVTSPVDYCTGATVVQPLSATGTGLLWYTDPTTGIGSPTAPTLSTPVLTGVTYYVTQTIAGCESPRVPINVTVSAPSFSIDAGAPLYISLGAASQVNPTLSGISSGQLSSILWTPPTGLNDPSILNPTITLNADGTYTYDVTITNSIGCTATDQLVVNVTSECIHIKNAFTPNGDGINELWEVYDQYSCLRNVKVHIYNRYGSKVYESDDYRNNWDGRFKGKPLPDGTYYAVIEFYQLSGKVFTARTDVTILR